MRKELEDSRTLAIIAGPLSSKHGMAIDISRSEGCDHFHPQDLHKIRPVDGPP